VRRNRGMSRTNNRKRRVINKLKGTDKFKSYKTKSSKTTQNQKRKKRNLVHLKNNFNSKTNPEKL
jgi:hypothetical protein